MAEADCPFGMSVRYAWDAERDLLESWHDIPPALGKPIHLRRGGCVTHTGTDGI